MKNQSLAAEAPCQRKRAIQFELLRFADSAAGFDGYDGPGRIVSFRMAEADADQVLRLAQPVDGN